MPRVRVSPLGPYKNESYDTIGIATFVLFFLSKKPVAQGFLAVGHKRIVSLCYSPALISMLFRGVLTPCSAAEIHNETFLKSGILRAYNLRQTTGISCRNEGL